VSLDIRHASDRIRRDATDELVRQAQEIAERRKLQVSWKKLLDQSAVPMDGFLQGQIALAVQRIGCEPHRMVSGAGHDAMILAERVPSAMIFLRTPGGVSHDPSETVLAGDVAKAIACGIQLLAQLAESKEFLTRTGRA
jgi:allantoate deiminase